MSSEENASESSSVEPDEEQEEQEDDEEEEEEKTEKKPPAKKQKLSEPAAQPFRGKGARKFAEKFAAQGKRHLKVLRDPIDGITKPAIRRLGLKANCLRFSGEIYDPVRIFIKNYLKRVMHRSVVYMEHGRRKTLASADVKHAIQHDGKTVYGYDKDWKSK